MKPNRLAVVLVLGAVLGAASLPHASAQVDGADGTGVVTATIIGGVRAVTTAGAIALANTTVGNNTATGTYSVLVTETARSGTNPWSVQGSFVADLVRTGDTNVIQQKAISLVARDVTLGTVVKVGTGADPIKDTALADAPTTGNTFGDATTNATTPQVLFRILNEEGNTAYTNTYTGTGTLNADVTGIPAGTYTGTFTYDLLQ